jgi:hypothetical protein
MERNELPEIFSGGFSFSPWVWLWASLRKKAPLFPFVFLSLISSFYSGGR